MKKKKLFAHDCFCVMKYAYHSEDFIVAVVMYSEVKCNLV